MYEYERKIASNSTSENKFSGKLISNRALLNKRLEFFSGYVLHAIKLLLAVLVMMSTIVVMCACISLANYRDDDYENLVYDHLIWPVVMHDPQPFNEENPPDKKLIWDSAVWYSVFDRKSSKFLRDENYNLILDKDEVINSIRILFGNKINLENTKITNSYFYDFDETNKKFTIKNIDNHEGFFPKILSCAPKGSTVDLKVGYVIPSEGFGNFDNNEMSEHKIKKIVNYELKKDPITHRFYISSVGRFLS